MKMSWDHPDGLPLEELDDSVPLTGVVVNIADFGVFVDVGYERNAILGTPARYWRKFRRGDILENLTVQRVDLEKRRFAVSLDDPERAIEDNRAPLEELREGTYVDGVVDNKNQFGVFVNIGTANCHGRLRVPRALGVQFLRGQVLRDLVIDNIDLEHQKIGLSIEDPDRALRELEMVGAQSMLGSQTAKPKAKAKSKPKSKPKTEQKAEQKLELKPEQKLNGAASLPPVLVSVPFTVGDLVDGVVTSIGSRGVIVDLGVEKSGTLIVPPELKAEFQKGDRVQGMRVEKISAGGAATLSMDDPELEVDEAPPSSQKISTAKVKAKAKAKSTVRPA